MNLKLSFFFLFLFFLFFYFFPFSNTQAAKPLDVVINEIAWMGTQVSYNDEWIELYNNTNSPIILDGWKLKAADGTPEINLTGTILPSGFYLLERTDDNTVANIKADLIYKGTLGNARENLELYDNSGNLIDKVDCSSGWFAGDNKTKQTMERKNSKLSDSTNWQSSQNPGGTPKAKNSEQKTMNNEQKTEQKETEETSVAEVGPPQVGSPQDYPGGIVFSEILPSPEGPDAEEEWIELFNQNNFEVDLAGWKIEDVSGKITTHTFPKETKISPQGFLVLPRKITKITLNNDEDGLALASPDGKIIDEINYKKAQQGESYNRINSNWVWSAALTPGAVNIEEKTEKTLAPEGKSLLETEEKGGLAAIGGQISKSSRFLFVLLIALAIAASSGIIIFILKKKLKENRPI